MKLTEHNIILTRTHRKTTSTETYLDYRSSHPKHLKHNFQYNQDHSFKATLKQHST